jgi:hypothetical protein
MKLAILAIAATVGLAVAAPTFAATAPGGTPKTTVKPPVKKKLALRMQCAKPVMIKGKLQCPPSRGASPKGALPKGETPKGAVPK